MKGGAEKQEKRERTFANQSGRTHRETLCCHGDGYTSCQVCGVCI